MLLVSIYPNERLNIQVSLFYLACLYLFFEYKQFGITSHTQLYALWHIGHWNLPPYSINGHVSGQNFFILQWYVLIRANFGLDRTRGYTIKDIRAEIGLDKSQWDIRLVMHTSLSFLYCLLYDHGAFGVGDYQYKHKWDLVLVLVLVTEQHTHEFSIVMRWWAQGILITFGLCNPRRYETIIDKNDQGYPNFFWEMIDDTFRFYFISWRSERTLTLDGFCYWMRFF